MSPVLADAASDLHVTTATAGQLRTITGLAAGITALGLGAVTARVGLGRQLLAALALPSRSARSPARSLRRSLLAVAQLPVGVAVAVLTTAGTLPRRSGCRPSSGPACSRGRSSASLQPGSSACL
jgi:Arabinose efflux permease